MEKQEEQIWKSLPCKFTPAEIATMKNNLAMMVEKQIEAENQKSESSKNHAAILKDLKQTIRDISKKISEGFENRPVECYKKLDFHRESAFIFRADTEEVVEERPLDEQERQLQINFMDNQANKLLEKEG